MDELIVGVLNNKAKIAVVFLWKNVFKMLKEVTKDLHNVRIEPFDGLLVDFAASGGCRCRDSGD